jgi:hypothetical protein
MNRALLLIGARRMSVAEFVKSLVGKKAGDLTALEAAIIKLNGEKSAAQAEMTRLAARRIELLLTDDDKALDADERLSEKAYRIIERADAILPDLELRRDAARLAQRKAEQAARWDEVSSEFFSTARDYLEHMRAARAGYDELGRIRGRAQNSGLYNEAASRFAVPTPLLDNDLLNAFGRAIEHAASLPPPGAPAVAAPAPAPKTEQPPKPAEVVVEFITPDVPVFGGLPPGKMGDRRRVPAADAWAWVNAGSARFVGKPPPRPATFASQEGPEAA